MIEAKNLSKNFGKLKAVDNISFQIKSGEIVGFLGPNGAGKTTTINMLSAYTAASAGQILINGFDLEKEKAKLKPLIGYLPETPPLYAELTVSEYLNFVAELKRVPRSTWSSARAKILLMLDIEAVLNRRIANLSKGYKQRVGFAQALVGDPPILIFDEPMLGLDPVQILEIRNLLTGLSATKTIILSSHILAEIEALCDRVLIMNKGVLVADDSPGALRKKLSDSISFVIELQAGIEEIRKILDGFSKINSWQELNSDKDSVSLVLNCQSQTPIKEELFYCLAEQRIPILQLYDQKQSLEDIFIDLTKLPSARADLNTEEGNYKLK